MGGADAGRPRHAAPGQRFDGYADFYQGSAYARFPQEHRTGGSIGASMLRVRQEPIDLIDAAVPDLVVISETGGGVTVDKDLGFGLVQATVPPGTITVVPHDTEARWRVSGEHGIMALALPAARLLPLLDAHGLRRGDGGVDAFAPFFARPQTRPSAVALMDRMWHRMAVLGPADGLWLDGAALQLLSMLTGEEVDRAALSPLGGARPEDARIRRAVECVEARLGEPLSLDAIAAVAALSPSHLSRAFRAATGEAVWAYVQRRRCERAREMLLGTRLPVTEIALACGYANPGHLATSLRRRWGTTPSALRRDAAG